MTNSLLEISNLNVTYGSSVAVQDISISIRTGELIGLVGHNGAGKTSLLNAIGGFMKITGDIKFEKSTSIQKNLSYVPDTMSLYNNLTCLEFFQFLSVIINKKEADLILQKALNYIDILDIQPYQNQLMGELSLGTKKKICVIAGLINSSKLLILDEPLNGLDPVSTKHILELLIQEKKESYRSIIISSHRLDIIDKISDNIIFLEKGKLKFFGPPSSITNLGLENYYINEYYKEIEMND